MVPLQTPLNAWSAPALLDTFFLWSAVSALPDLQMQCPQLNHPSVTQQENQKACSYSFFCVLNRNKINRSLDIKHAGTETPSQFYLHGFPPHGDNTHWKSLHRSGSCVHFLTGKLFDSSYVLITHIVFRLTNKIRHTPLINGVKIYYTMIIPHLQTQSQPLHDTLCSLKNQRSIVHCHGNVMSPGATERCWYGAPVQKRKAC